MLGRNNPIVRRLRALRRDAKLRRDERVLLAEGRHLAEAALAHRADIELAVVTPTLAHRTEDRRLLEQLTHAGCPCLEVSGAVMESLQDARSPQPVLLVVRRAEIDLHTAVPAAGRPLVVVVDGVQDPGNLGSILRTADAAGADALLATGSGADLCHPRTVRASMGSIFRVPALATPLEPAVELLESRGIASVAAVPEAPTSYGDHDFRRATALFLGGEGAGLPACLVQRLDHRVGIPMRHGVDSLSVGAAAAVLLFEAARQRESRSGTCTRTGFRGRE